MVLQKSFFQVIFPIYKLNQPYLAMQGSSGKPYSIFLQCYAIDVVNAERSDFESHDTVHPGEINLPAFGKQRNNLRAFLGADPHPDAVNRGEILYLGSAEIPLVAAPAYEVDKPLTPPLIEEQLDAHRGVFERG